jgi:cytochrome c
MKTTKIALLLLMVLVSALAYSQSVAPNTLTEKEKKEGWKLLFDGKSTTGWRTYNSKTVGPAWKVKDGALYLDTLDKKDWQTKGGDIVTDKEFENFELTLDWKIAPCGNSGVIFNVVESKKNEYVWYTGPEIQILDNSCHPDGKIPKHRAGNLYDLIASKTESVKPAGEWNHYKIISNKGLLEIWLNEVEQVKTQMFTPEWGALIKESKFKNRPDFGKAHKGKISLQDHGNMVWFMNVKIKEL